MTSKCLICDTEILNNGINAPIGKSSNKKYRTSTDSVIPPVLCDRSKFALTNIQCTVLQKVLSLPDGACKNELIIGPYCRECFTNINNVCHCMSALENLQQSVVEFRKEFGNKIQKSCGDETTNKISRKRKTSTDNEPVNAARSMILNYLSKSEFTVGAVPLMMMNNSKPKHIHEIISNMDPNTQFPDTHVNAEMVIRTTNGNMPPKQRNGPTVKIKKRKSKKQITTTKTSPKRKYTKKSDKLATSTSTKSKVSINENEQWTVPEYKCWCCSKTFYTEAEMKVHEETSHRHKCTVQDCSRVFYTAISLNSHMIKLHKITIKKPIDTRRMKQCNDCSLYFPNHKSLLNHQTKQHSIKIVIKKKKPITNINSTTGKKIGGRPGRCKVCKKIVLDVNTHMRVEHPDHVQQKTLPTTASSADNNPSETTTNNNSVAPPSEEDKKFKRTTKNSSEIKLDSFEQENDEKKKTDVNDNDGTETKAIDDKLAPRRPITFQIPTSLLPVSAQQSSPQQTSSSNASASNKYQFKNLLKIGDKP